MIKCRIINLLHTIRNPNRLQGRSRKSKLSDSDNPIRKRKRRHSIIIICLRCDDRSIHHRIFRERAALRVPGTRKPRYGIRILLCLICRNTADRFAGAAYIDRSICIINQDKGLPADHSRLAPDGIILFRLHRIHVRHFMIIIYRRHDLRYRIIVYIVFAHA